MAKIKLTVLGFTQYQLTDEEEMTSDTTHLASVAEEYDSDIITAVVLHEVDGTRHLSIRLREHEARVLARIHGSPGEPLLMHETAVHLLRMAGIIVHAGHIEKGSESETIGFSTVFQHEDKTWNEPMFAFDMIGYAMAGTAPILIEEEFLNRLSQNELPLERIGLGPDQVDSLNSAEQLARELPGDKLTKN